MVDYKELYLKMFRASEKAINLLIQTQQECEELFIADEQSESQIISFPAQNKKGIEEE